MPLEDKKEKGYRIPFPENAFNPQPDKSTASSSTDRESNGRSKGAYRPLKKP